MWHCHVADDRAGSAPDYFAADSQLKEAIADGSVMVAVSNSASKWGPLAKSLRIGVMVEPIWGD